MTIEQKIAMALARSGMSQAELARRLHTTPPNLNQKIKRETLKQDELEEIGRILGGEWYAHFVFEDGTVI